MPKQTIGIGSSANDGTGDTIRAAFDKVNDNFTELYGETLTADFVTTIASQFPEEPIFTPVPVTAGKTYRFEAEFWVKWATALASGDATLNEPSMYGTLTVDTNESRAQSDVAGTTDANGFGNDLAAVVASTAWQRVHVTGRFKATNSDNFNLGLMVAGWDAGDPVTVGKGAWMTVEQID